MISIAHCNLFIICNSPAGLFCIFPAEDLPAKSEENISNISAMLNFKSMKIGVLGLSGIFLLLSIYCMLKGISASGFISMICGYNAFSYIIQYSYTKDRTVLLTGVIFAPALVLNLVVFILNTI